MVDIGEYCRRVEQHLTKVNGGHLVRIVGPGFELVRTWAQEGVPMSVVFHAINLKAERHHAGRARRPLRLEFCDSDVRAVFEQWRRSVGVPTSSEPDTASSDGGTGDEAHPAAEGRRRPSVSKHLERVIDRLSRTIGRVDVPEPFREALDGVLADVVNVRNEAKTRGAAREEIAGRLKTLDERLVQAMRLSVGSDERRELELEAEADLAPFRLRLGADTWQTSVQITVDRLLRGRWGLPAIELVP